MAENPTLATGPQGVGGGLRGSGMSLFLKRWVSNPRRIGAILPSAMHLARIMTHASVEARCGAGPVVELGPGTGSITRALLASGIAEEALVLIERDRELCRWLEHRFPGAVVIEGEAARIGALLGKRAVGTPSVVVSSLPLRNLVEDERDAIIRECLDVLPRGGTVVQFTYARRPAISFERLEVECQRIGVALLNVPPASVWRIRRLHDRASRRRSEAHAARNGIRRSGRAHAATRFVSRLRRSGLRPGVRRRWRSRRGRRRRTPTFRTRPAPDPPRFLLVHPVEDGIGLHARKESVPDGAGR